MSKKKNVNVCKLSSVYFYLQNITMLKWNDDKGYLNGLEN